MMKRILFIAAFIVCFAGIRAQEQQEMEWHQMPLDPAVKHGVLPNGLNYFILHNEEPKDKANFYIAQKVGSELEDENQLGLAHFLEHMAFNGLEHFPGKKLLNYLQSKGIRFGYEINAFTGLDRTVYRINGVNTRDEALMDSVLLALYDWSGSILLEEAEIDDERGVIQGEYVQTHDAQERMMEYMLPRVYKEYQYTRLPIGSMEVIKNFTPQELRDYYKKWYRPDLQGIVVVGDFDADAMEKKVIELFSKIPTPQNAAERVYTPVSDNEEPIYVAFNDPEMSSTSIATFFKYDPTPLENRNTIESFLYDNLISTMVEVMINNRLDEFAKKADCPYASAGVDIGQFMVSKTKGSFTVDVTPKNGVDLIDAYRCAMGIVTQACKTGFMGTEVQRVRDDILSGLEKRKNEKDKTNSHALGQMIYDYFLNNTPYPGPEMKYNLAYQYLNSFPEMIYNELAKELIHPDNVVILVTQPTAEDMIIPEEKTVLNALNDVINADYEPYVDEVITEPLISKLPTPGKIKRETADIDFGTKTYILSNGVKVIVKSTDFANDEILMTAYKKGGKFSYPSSEAANLDGKDMILDCSNIGPFNNIRLQKYLAGKHVGINYRTDALKTVLSASSVKKDVTTMFELVYAAFTDVTKNQEAFDVEISQALAQFQNMESNPMYKFQDQVYKILYPTNPMLRVASTEQFKSINYDKAFELYKQSVSNAADYTFVIVGNVDENSLKPLLTQYIATLPSKGKADAAPKIVTPMEMPSGKIEKTFDITSTSPSVYVWDNVHQANIPYNNYNDICFSIFRNVLESTFTATIREEMGATYSTQVITEFTYGIPYWSVSWIAVTNEDQQQALRERAIKEFKDLVANGASAEYFNRAKEAMLSQYDSNVRTNRYWLQNLWNLECGYNMITDRRRDIEDITLENFNNFIKNVYDGQNFIEIVGFAK